ncbi:helix-turn-helix transcriptional regulator [Aestuariirhabdus sp. LZHN29]|uniref:helix-turn-helix transcriptional regulator n=1 Tax=Aestuariirhabdus sp. LZHN29 TaxID=3417462 RepID=UPI003CF57214
MGKRAGNIETLSLSLEILRRIPKHGSASAKEIHEQLLCAGIHRDIRTIQRQLDMLSLEFDIERDDRTKPYGYRWMKSSSGFSVPMLSEQESLLLTLAEQYLHNLLPPKLMKSMEPFFKQSRRKLDDSNKPEHEWRDKVRVVDTSQPLLPPPIAEGVFESVSAALYQNHWLHIQYVNASEYEAEYDVMPLGLAQQGTRLYLVCRFDGYDNERSIALHRIVSARVKTIRFTRPHNFSLEKYDFDGRFGFGEGQKIRLRFTVDREAGYHLLESKLSNDQKAIVSDDHIVITATVIESAMLEWWVRGFGDLMWDVVKQPIKD